MKNSETVLDVSRWDQHVLNPKTRDKAAIDWWCTLWCWWWRWRFFGCFTFLPSWPKPISNVNLLCILTHTHLTALCPGLPGSAGTRKVKPIWILLKQETVSGSGISWGICKSAPSSRQITMPAPPLVFYRPDALPAAQPTASKHWRHNFAYLHMDKYMPDTSATGLNCESAAFKVPLLRATINLITNATSI